MEKEFVPYVLSKQIKQLGFKEECLGYYVDVEVANPFLVINRINDTQGGYFTLAPTFSQTFRWFREKFYLHSCISAMNNGVELLYAPMIDIIDKKHKAILDFNDYKTYEEAEIGCLKKLIEIVKNGNCF